MTDGAASFKRRNLLLGALRTIPAVALVGEAGASRAASTEAYQPVYFSAAEWDFLKSATERLIPADENGPSARELGVPEFIDRQMEGEYGQGGFWYLQGPFNPDAAATLGYQLRFNPRDLYRVAIKDIDNWCGQNHGMPFAGLAPALQDKILAGLEKGTIELPHVRAGVFFAQFLGNTKEGYFADPMYGGNRGMAAWEMIGFPGARADFADWSKHPGEAYPLGPVSILGEKA